MGSRRSVSEDTSSPGRRLASASGVRSFFGPSPESLLPAAGEVQERHGKGSPEYAAAMVNLGDAYMLHGIRRADALAAYAKALMAYRLTGPSDPRRADVHERIASALRGLRQPGRAAEHLKRAIAVLELTDLPDPHRLRELREELEELRKIHSNQLRRSKPPSAPG